MLSGKLMNLDIRASLFYSLHFSIVALVMAWLWRYDLTSAIVSVIYGWAFHWTVVGLHRLKTK